MANSVPDVVSHLAVAVAPLPKSGSPVGSTPVVVSQVVIDADEPALPVAPDQGIDVEHDTDEQPTGEVQFPQKAILVGETASKQFTWDIGGPTERVFKNQGQLVSYMRKLEKDSPTDWAAWTIRWTGTGSQFFAIRPIGEDGLPVALTASDQIAGIRFGDSLAMSGDGNTLVVGSPVQSQQRGAVYVFGRAAGAWSQRVKLQPADVAPVDRFGQSVSVSDDGQYVLVGSPHHETTSADGAVYLYSKTGSTWSEQKFRFDYTDGDFGTSVAISGNGNAFVVGTPDQQTGTPGFQRGRVYVFRQSGASWVHETLDGTVNYIHLGIAVAMNADGTVCAFLDSPAGVQTFHVWFRASANDSWTKTTVTASVVQTGGISFLAISGDGNTIVGGRHARVFVLTRSGNAWIEQYTFNSPSRIGSVALDQTGDVMVTGWPAFGGGVAVRWIREDNRYVPQAITDSVFTDSYGSSVAVARSGLMFASGAPTHDAGSLNNSGAVQVVQTPW